MFVQVIQGRATDAAGLRKQIDMWKQELMPGATGFLGSTFGVTDDGNFIMTARFESEEAARRSSDRPEQGQWWSETESYVEGAQFHDCSECEEWLAGGSDDAGFVQVIQGRAKDRDVFRQRMSGMEDEPQNRRPDVIGGTIAWHDDKDFTEVVYFTSEAEAREGEKRSSEGGDEENWMDLLEGEPTFYDLREPQMISP